MENVDLAFVYMFRGRGMFQVAIGAVYAALAGFIAIIGTSIGIVVFEPYGGEAFFVGSALFTLLGASFLIGYCVDVVQTIHYNPESPLPSWFDVGQKARNGLQLGAALFVYQIPALAALIAATSSSAIAEKDVAEAVRNTAEAVSAGACCVLPIIWLFFFLLQPAAVISFAERPSFAAAFNISFMIRLITANFGAYLVVVALCIITSVLASLGIALFGIGFLLTSVWAMLVQAHLLGQYRRATGEAISLADANPYS